MEKENRLNQSVDQPSRVEVAAVATGVVAWPLFILTYTPLESQLQQFNGPIELAALASLLFYVASRANKSR